MDNLIYEHCIVDIRTISEFQNSIKYSFIHVHDFVLLSALHDSGHIPDLAMSIINVLLFVLKKYHYNKCFSPIFIRC